MIPIDFPEANLTFGKPKGMTDEECSDLRVFKGPGRLGYTFIVSKWLPNKEDIEAINKGEGIYLFITGEGMPPVCLQTENPFT